MVVSESIVGDLDVLDTLELFESTIYAAEALGFSQSSCSRRYPRFQERCLPSDQYIRGLEDMTNAPIQRGCLAKGFCEAVG